MTYATQDDLLLGDLQLGSTVDPNEWLNRAADEIDSKIGALYELPLAGLAAHELLMLRRINAHLATGRMLLSLDGNTDEVHAYGRMLVEEALGEIASIANGTTRLSSQRVAGVVQSTGPSIVVEDAYSATEHFNGFAFGDPAFPRGSSWRPGA